VIYSHNAVRAAVARALILKPEEGHEAAIQAAAEALHLDVDEVRALVPAVEEVRAIVQPVTEDESQ